MRAESGHYTFTAPPFGYRMENNTLIPVQEEAEIVIRIYKEYLCGMGVSKIVSGLNSDPDVPGKPWRKEGVRYILANEKYIGDSLFQKSFTPNELPFRNRVNRGEVEKYDISGTHEVIMDRKLHSAVQEMLRRNVEKQAKKARPRKFNFSNKIFCASCGWTYKQ
ncbi:MAG: recombinase family protein [Clostridia bacterium]